MSIVYCTFKSSVFCFFLIVTIFSSISEGKQFRVSVGVC